MTVEIVSRELSYNGKPGRSFRKSKEDLALFEHLPDSHDLDSCLDVEPDALAGGQLLEGSIDKDVSDSDTDKNDDDWLVPAPEASVSPQSHPSNLIMSRNLSAIKTSRSATLEPTRIPTPQRNPSPRVYKSPQESHISPSKIPRFNASNRNITVRKSSPGPSSIPRASSTPRTSTPSPIPRASSSPRTSASGIRPPSPKSKWTSSTKTTPAQTPKSTLAAKGSSPTLRRTSTTSPSTSTVRKLSSNYGSSRKSPASSSVTNLPTQPGSARSVKSAASPSVKAAAKATKPTFACDFLSETPANLRTDPFTKRAGSGHGRSLSRSYEGPSCSGSSSGSPRNFQDYVSKSQDRGSSELSRSQDRGVFQYLGSKDLTGDGRASNSDEDFSTKIPAYGGVGRRTLKKNDDLLQSSQQSLGRATTLYQHDKSAAEDYSFMGRSLLPDPSCSTGYTAQAQSSLNSSFGFKPFMTNSLIPSFSQHRKLRDPEFEAPHSVSIAGNQDSCEDITPVATKSSWDAPKNRFGFGVESSNATKSSNRFGYGKEAEKEASSSDDQTSTVKRIQMGFALKKEDVGMHTELPTSSLIDTKANSMEVGIPHLSTTAMVSHVEDKGPVKIYQGLGDMEDMEDMGGNWCCGMADRYRDLCKQHDCAIFKNFHNALLLNNASPEFIKPCSSTSSQDSLNDKSFASESDEDAPVTFSESLFDKQKEENKPACQPIDSTPISEFLQQLSPNDHILNCTSHGEADDRDSAQRNSLTDSSSCANSDLSGNSGADVDEEERRTNVKENTIWKLHAPLKSPEDTPLAENKTRRSKLEKGELSGKKNGYNKWDLDITEASSWARQLGKPPDFFDVTKRNEDGGIIAAISSVKSLSASECGDDDQRGNGKFTNSRNSELFNRSSSMNGSHVSHSDSEDEEEVDQVRATRAFSPESDATLARSDSEGEMVKSKTSNYLEESDYHGTASAQSDHSHSDTPDDSPRELMSEFSRASSTKSNVRRFFSTSATSIDLTRSIDTTCSTQSPYEYNIWEGPSDCGRFGDPMSANLRSAPQKSSMHMEIREPVKVEGACSDVETQAALYDYGLEKLAGYIRSASVNARKRRASVASSEADSKISLSRESSFDYFVDFFETQANSDPEARAVADLLVSAHIESKRVEFSPGCSNLKRMNSLLSSSSLRSEKSVEAAMEECWESNKSIQTLENSGDGMEQIVENATPHASLDKHFSSFKFGQKKYPAGEFESITTLEVVPESPTSDSGLSPSRRRSAKQFSGLAISEPSPLCQKFLKEIEEQHNLCEGLALSALKSAPLEPVARKSVELPRSPKEEEGFQASPASPLDPKCESPRISSRNDIADSCNEIKLVVAEQTIGDVEKEKEKERAKEKEKDKEKDKEKEKEDKEKDKEKEKEDKEKENEKEKAKVKPDEEPDSQLEIEKAMVEQVLLPPVPNQMSKDAPKDAPVMSPMRMTSASPTKRANGHEVGDNNEKTCGCTIL